jgi:hypothetical protein
MQQKTEIPFDDLTMESRDEVTRVIRFYTLPHPATWNDQVREQFVRATEGGYQINFVTEAKRPPVIEVMFEGGFTFIFHLYDYNCDLEHATRLFNEFIEANAHDASEFFIDHLEWVGVETNETE